MLSGWSVFLSPMTGIVISDYFLVRHGEYHLGDMYMGNPRSAYWYDAGFNWRCFAAWLLGMAPLLPGFARAIKGVSSGSGWDHLYEMSYPYGFVASLVMHWVLHAIFPAERQRGSSPFVLEEHAEMLYIGESDSATRPALEDEERVVAVSKM